MQVYLVGGAVRDALLGLPVKERDWVVVGGTREALLEMNYREVGRDFPVFLHPDTREEYALARTERKGGSPGYRGFVVEFGPEVTLEEDLARRDLTINAIAQSADGSLVDPYGGRTRHRSRTLRHVSACLHRRPRSSARVARFAARFAPLGFRGCAGDRGIDAQHGRAPRSGRPGRRARMAGNREGVAGTVGQHLLQGVARMRRPARIYPEIDALFGVPQPAQWHPEIDTGIHTLMVLDQAAALSADTRVRFAALVHDLGKALTPSAQWPSHRGHEERSVALIEALADRLRLPSDYRELALIVARHHGIVHRAFELKPKTLLDFMERTDAFRRPERFSQALLACEADARGRTGLESNPYPQRGLVSAAREIAAAVKPSAEDVAAHKGAKIAEAIHARAASRHRRISRRIDRRARRS